MPAMNPSVVGVSLVALCAGSSLAAQQKLQPMDMFRLSYFMQQPAEEPLDWVDDEHYLVFDTGPKGGPGAKTWSKVHARTGKRAPFVTRDAFAKALGLEGAAKEALDDEDVYTWSDDHTRAVLDVEGDLWSVGLDGTSARLTNTPDDEEVGVRFSPDGASVAFIADYNLHVVPAAGGEVRALTTDGHADLFYGRLDWVYQEELYGRYNFQGLLVVARPATTIAFLLKLDRDAGGAQLHRGRSRPAGRAVPRARRRLRASTNYPKVGEPNPIVPEIGVIDVGERCVPSGSTSRSIPDDRPPDRARHVGAGEQAR